MKCEINDRLSWISVSSVTVPSQSGSIHQGDPFFYRWFYMQVTYEWKWMFFFKVKWRVSVLIWILGFWLPAGFTDVLRQKLPGEFFPQGFYRQRFSGQKWGSLWKSFVVCSFNFFSADGIYRWATALFAELWSVVIKMVTSWKITCILHSYQKTGFHGVHTTFFPKHQTKKSAFHQVNVNKMRHVLKIY